MPPYLSPLYIAKPTIPAHCEPANDFLYRLSATFHTCVPTNLALLSTFLGSCSIIAWLFAQLPQIYKNHKLKSTSGLSAFFLTEWLLGDVTNLLGCLFTGQASWQIIIASYYVFVDCCLCAQWVWYEMLHHGRPLRPIWGRWNTAGRVEGKKTKAASPSISPDNSTMDKADAPSESVPRSSPRDSFRAQDDAHPPVPTNESSQDRTSSKPHVRRVAASSPPMPSPKTMLYLSLLLAVLANPTLAQPMSPFAPSSYHAHSVSTPTSPPSALSPPLTASQLAGKIFSWLSTCLYLGSRLPQLYKNQKRRSTAGLSPTLFAAAFFGNLFYSASLLANPCAWHDYRAGAGAGWVGPEGSVRRDWVARAMPFFLGAAGVLAMDAAVGLQFVYFGDAAGRGRARRCARTDDDDDVLVTVEVRGSTVRRRLHWRRVSGWMRGWAPSVSVAATPLPSPSPSPSPSPWGVRAGSVASVGSEAGSSTMTTSQGIPIQGGNALEEARALLGTGRHASPRSYGAVGSPR